MSIIFQHLMRPVEESGFIYFQAHLKGLAEYRDTLEPLARISEDVP